jgi:hypothetical protein
MRLSPGHAAASRGAAAALVLLTAGCGHLSGLRWPWHHPPPPPPAPVHELDITGAAADAFPQYWKRNTLLVDLSAASGSGSLTLKPLEGSTWPVRLAFRVRPGTIGVLEVRAAQRVSLPINTTPGRAIELELEPGVYTPQSPEMRISWGPASAAAPDPQSTPMR